MKAFTAIIYIKPITATDEKIAVGLLASGINKIHFAYSVTKLHKAFGLANMSIVSNPLERYLKNISKSIEESNAKEIHFPENYILTMEYLTYLNKYDTGIIYFEKPTSMAFPVNDKQFAEIFKLILGEALVEKSKTPVHSFSKSFRDKIENRIVFKTKADIIYKINPDKISSIINPVEVDFISVNGAISAGMHIDFSTEVNTIVKHIYEYKSLAFGLNKYSAKKKYKESSVYAIYFNNPEGKEQKEVLNKLCKDDSVEGIKVKESDSIEKDIEKIENKEYRKFSLELEGR